jgi:hypothetical protein
VLQAELEAFNDSGSVVESKRSLFDMQVKGSFEGEGRRRRGGRVRGKH